MVKHLCPSQNPRAKNLGEVDHRLKAFLSFSEVGSLSLDLSITRLLQSVPSNGDSDLINCALKMASLFFDIARHSSRKRASNHNSLSWPLPPDLTIKGIGIPIGKLSLYTTLGELLKEFMRAVKQNYGEKVLIQFEDSANHNAFDLLEKYNLSHLFLNDDIHGTQSVVLAGLLASLKLVGGTLADHTFLFLGAKEIRV
ncbi:hypothetical protein JHK82_052479 [Glycine max]|nr:hypothetical protein JHK86_052323 [Glycine max]KAG5085082.1 hypothetical protein JHK82_052479 [Glycine max]